MLMPRPPINPARCGALALYRAHEINHCPGCGRTHWHIGRLSAECAFCSTALPLEQPIPIEKPQVTGWKGTKQ